MSEENDMIKSQLSGDDGKFEKVALSDTPPKKSILSSLFQTSSDSEEKRYRLLEQQKPSCCFIRQKK